jgi:hypothetical protein
MMQTGANRKNIGEAMARRIENACGKPAGWLDMDEAAKPDRREPWPFNFSRELWEALSTPERRELEETFQTLLLGAHERRKKPRRKAG